MSTCGHIARRRKQLPVRPLCQALRVAPSAYYSWQPRARTPVRQAFARHAGPPDTTQQPRAFVLRPTDSDPNVRAAPNRFETQLQTTPQLCPA